MMFQFLDHPSETLVEVRAADAETVFREAALALFEVMTDTTVLAPELRFAIRLEPADRASLLIDWLNRLILLHEVEHVFLGHFEFRLGSDGGADAVAAGERIGENHERRSHVKSATFGMLEWRETPDGHVVRFVLDV